MQHDDLKRLYQNDIAASRQIRERERERTCFAEFISNGKGKVKATELLRDSYFNFKIIMKSVWSFFFPKKIIVCTWTLVSVWLHLLEYLIWQCVSFPLRWETNRERLVLVCVSDVSIGILNQTHSGKCVYLCLCHKHRKNKAWCHPVKFSVSLPPQVFQQVL